MSIGRPRSIPSYRKHKQSGQAIVCLTDPLAGRRDYLLGRHGSAASKREYERLVAEWLANGKRLSPAAGPSGPGVTVAELVHRFKDHAEAFYRRPDGTPTTEVREYRASLKPLAELYGMTPAREFGPLALKAVRQRFVAVGCCRSVVNRRVGRIRHLFKWAVSEELVPGSVYADLMTVAGLARGRGAAPERTPVQPVAAAVVEATVPYLNRHVAGLVRFQQLTGARPAEACQLRACDLDMTGDVWLYRPQQHKLAWRNKPRVIAVGPRAQQLVREFLTVQTEDYLFSPQRARDERYAAMRAARRSKVQPSQECRAKERPQKTPADKYDSSSYQHAVTAACRRAGLPHSHPNQLRHLHATTVRKSHGLEAASITLGHGSAMLTDAVYAERDLALVLKVRTGRALGQPGP
jgi:integrase